jgi:hypothetical protein
MRRRSKVSSIGTKEARGIRLTPPFGLAEYAPFWISGVVVLGGTMFFVTTISDLVFRRHKLNGVWEVGWLALSLLL